MPIDYDDYLDVLFFYIGSKTPLHINMMICFVYLDVRQLLMIYMFVLGVDPEAHDQ